MRAAATDIGAGAVTESDSAEPESRKLIGVMPASAAEERRELLAVLEQVFPVRFQGRELGELHDLDGLLAVALTSQQNPRQEAGREQDAGFEQETGFEQEAGFEHNLAGRCPCLVVWSSGGPPRRSRMTVELAEDAQLARALRGRALSEECAAASPAPVPLDGDRVLAHASGRPLWWRRGGECDWVHHSVFCPLELGDGEALRDRLRAGHFMGLAPLLHLIQHVCKGVAWEGRPQRAAFVVDDPNLHSRSYGYLNYRRLVAHAERHGYHVALATVPLDGWRFSRRTADLLRASPAVSMLMHGNDHIAGELGRLTDDREALHVLAQALRRIAAFERRCGVAIERVMVPPHELCSTAALAAMFRLGFEGACIGRRHPWRDARSLAALGEARLLKWYPADLLDGGLPVIPRYPIELSREDLVFRALLGQPLILFAHHGDFADGLDLLAQRAAEINGLGETRWESVGEIARTNFLTRCSGRTLYVQMSCRRALVHIPPQVDTLRVETPSLTEGERQRWLAHGASCVALHRAEGRWCSGPLRVTPGSQIELALQSDHPVAAETVAAPRRTPWPLVRRLLVEGRDRARPMLGR